MTLPTFIIIGAHKAGTTSLFEYLSQHPEVYRSPIKEPRFFAFDPDNPEHVASDYSNFRIRTLEDYEALFAGAQDERALGEASPVYFGSLVAPGKMKAIVPDVKLILCLRHPVHRLYSLYLMNSRSGKDKRSLREACEPGGVTATDNKYSPRLALWLDKFSRDQIHIVILEELKKDSMPTLQATYRFLGIDDDYSPDLSKQHNVGGVAKNRAMSGFYRTMKRIRGRRAIHRLRPYVPQPFKTGMSRIMQSTLTRPEPMPDDLADALGAFYKEDVLELEDLLGIDLSIWKL